MHRSLRSAVAALTLVLLALGLAACGGSDDDRGSATTTSTAVEPGDGSGGTGLGDEVDSTGGTDTGADPSGAGLPDDACALLDDATAQALLGTAATGTEGVSSLAEGTPQFVSCYWGQFTDDAGVVSVAVSSPSGSAGIDYLSTLAEGAGGTATPVPVGEDGELLDAFVMPGGGGVGSSVLFHQDGLTVVVARSGDAVDTAALESAAADVSSRV